MNLKQLKYVLVLSQENSFSAAAEVLNISQPSLSQYIKNIEKQVGMPLFERLNGEVKLTDAGRIYIDAGRKILDLEHQMENKLCDLSEFKSGTITIGISPYRSVHMMPSVLKAFDRLYPNIKLIVKERSGSDLIEAAKRGEFDLCVIALPVDQKLFNFELIQREEILIAVNKESDFYNQLNSSAKRVAGRKHPAVDISMVNGQDFAVLSEYMPMRTVTDKMIENFDLKINEKAELSSNEALLSIVKSGVCASFIPSGLTDGKHEKIACFSIVQDVEFRDIAVIYRKEQYCSKPIRDLIEIFKSLE